MVLRDSVNTESLLEGQFDRRRFTRRTDLTNEIRLIIGANALYATLNGAWGTITNLADEYGISRTFVYSLAKTLRDAGYFLFDELTQCVDDLSLRVLSIQMMLSLRMEGQSSVSGTSEIMKRFECELSSLGSVSQTTSRIGRLLPTTVSLEDGMVQYLVFASDEIFSKTTPILITADPGSSAILRIELADSRKADDWKNHFEGLFDNGVKAIYLVSDEGAGLCAGHAEAMNDVVRQSDTYHAIAHLLGQWVNRLETAAYKAIGLEHEREKRLNSAKSDRVQERRLNECIRISGVTEQAITLYDSFSYLYLCLLRELNVFDRNGYLRNRQQAEDALNVGFALIDELKHKKISEAVEKSRRTLSDLLHYFDIAKKIINECKDLPISESCMRAYCLAWQWGKAVRKAKKSARKNIAQENERFYREFAESIHQKGSTNIQKVIYAKLDKIVQSSAMVECINSIIRPYLNTCKNHISQELLNLIMFYHNHRRYRDGARKGKTPMELLTGKEQAKDWMAILFDTIKEKDPELLVAS